ncbi:nucleoside-diphosphate sugar epimerase/dehydratase [Georgenia sp. H159]|uniref:polysaccharide biosynthesis protein n=1 Tax=Georgenia sp. H159 TaxID=3076115 RepID=UPI002D791157|nr:nucleoside-diphosphate sugar epimerase/dehydratase [Georgenia sp. H159]
MSGGTTLVRRSLIGLWDCAAWCIAVGLIVGTRYEFYLSVEQWNTVFLYMGLACLTQLVIGALLKIYRGKYRVGSFEESLGLLLSMVVVALALLVAFVLIRGLAEFPRGIAFLAPPFALIIMAAGRWAYRAWTTSKRPSSDDAENVLIYGAGDAGYQLLRLVDMDTSSPYRVVGLLDDDPRKRHLSLLGRQVLGGREDLVRRAHERDVTTVILAISAASKSMIAEVADVVERAGMKFLLLPPLNQILGGRVKLSDVKEVDIADILGRRQVNTDIGSIASYLTDKRVLVTGAGGSIGSELARQVHKFGPAELILLDRDESALHGVQLSIYGKALLDTPDMVLASIRDKEALREVFERHQPQVVFHAAALKHLPMLEQYPDEGWKTNVVGTQNLLELSAEFEVEKFVNISTDKAANPTSVLGKTKRLAEQLTAWFGQHASGTYLSVRFGNVLGSRGSMLHTFRQQIDRGGPVTVTHPDVTRYFMTIPEASELVIQAGAIGSDGEVLVLDMGEPVKILDVARRLVTHSGQNIEIVFTGLRPNEKLHEDLFSEHEDGVRPHHPLVSHVSVPPIDPSHVERTVETSSLRHTYAAADERSGEA